MQFYALFFPEKEKYIYGFFGKYDPTLHKAFQFRANN